jgi:hypothetical protein
MSKRAQEATNLRALEMHLVRDGNRPNKEVSRLETMRRASEALLSCATTPHDNPNYQPPPSMHLGHILPTSRAMPQAPTPTPTPTPKSDRRPTDMQWDESATGAMGEGMTALMGIKLEFSNNKTDDTPRQETPAPKRQKNNPTRATTTSNRPLPAPAGPVQAIKTKRGNKAPSPAPTHIPVPASAPAQSTGTATKADPSTPFKTDHMAASHDPMTLEPLNRTELDALTSVNMVRDPATSKALTVSEMAKVQTDYKSTRTGKGSTMHEQLLHYKESVLDTTNQDTKRYQHQCTLAHRAMLGIDKGAIANEANFATRTANLQKIPEMSAFASACEATLRGDAVKTIATHVLPGELANFPNIHHKQTATALGRTSFIDILTTRYPSIRAVSCVDPEKLKMQRVEVVPKRTEDAMYREANLTNAEPKQKERACCNETACVFWNMWKTMPNGRIEDAFVGVEWLFQTDRVRRRQSGALPDLVGQCLGCIHENTEAWYFAFERLQTEPMFSYQKIENIVDKPGEYKSSACIYPIHQGAYRGLVGPQVAFQVNNFRPSRTDKGLKSYTQINVDFQ